MILAERFAECVRQFRNRIAVSDPLVSLDYRKLEEATAHVAGRIARRRRTDDTLRVGLLAENSADYVVYYLAVLRAGGVPFLFDAKSGPRELTTRAEECMLDLLVHDSRALGDLAVSHQEQVMGLQLTSLTPINRRRPMLATTEVCRFTSGSTGRPHCIEFSGQAVLAAAVNWAQGTELTCNDRIACFAGLSNGLAFNTSLMSAFVAGASVHLSTGLPTGTQVARVLRRSSATRLVGFPALYQSVLRRGLAAETFGRMRIAISSGAPLGLEVRREFHIRTGVSISDYYGVAETGPLTFAPSPGLDGGLGAALPGVKLLAGEATSPAEIRVISESMGSRYLNTPGVLESRHDHEGYYCTADEGYLRAGELFLTGRTDRYLNMAGRKVDPVEIGQVLREADGVSEAVVFAAIDQHGEPMLAAAVACDFEVDIVALRRHCASQLAEYKVPARIHTVAQIPGNAIGKPALPVLRAMIEAGAAQDVTGSDYG